MIEENKIKENDCQNNEEKNKVSFIYSIFVVFVVFGFVAFGIVVWEAPLEIMFLLSWIIVTPLLMRLGYRYSELQKYAWDMATNSFESNVILVVVGMMIAVWMSSGTIPAIIYYGLSIMSPKYFLLSALLLSSFTSLATGTSWGTLGTAGLALIAIGNAMGIASPMTAGAIISGAYFGDKMSPISDSTILAATISEVSVFTHIKHMLYTTVPAYIISSILFLYLGVSANKSMYDPTISEEIMRVIDLNLNISLISLIPIFMVIILLIMKMPSIPALLLGTIAGIIVSIINNGYSVITLIDYMMNGFFIETGYDFVDKLLNRGGIMSMIGPYLAIFFALCISGMLDKTGVLSKLVEPLLKICKDSVFKTILSTLILTYITNAIGSSMLFASIVTATLMKDTYRENNLAPENLSRSLEDGGTLGAVLIPWNANSIYASKMLGVLPIEFIPYCFLNYLTPIISLLYAKTGLFISMINKDK